MSTPLPHEPQRAIDPTREASNPCSSAPQPRGRCRCSTCYSGTPPRAVAAAPGLCRVFQAVEPLAGRRGRPRALGGRCPPCLHRAPGETWDEVLLVEYPSRDAFVAMVQSPAYQAIVHHRSAALRDARLIVTTGILHKGRWRHASSAPATAHRLKTPGRAPGRWAIGNQPHHCGPDNLPGSKRQW